jgi:tricorn protease-like protein
VPAPENDEKDDRKRAPRRINRLAYKFDNEGWTIDRPHHIHVVPADGSGEVVQLTSGDFEDLRPSWSPDGERLAFASARHADWDIVPGEDIYVVPAAGGAPELLTATDGSASLPSWSPDGSRVAYTFTPGVFDDPRHTQVAVVDVATRDRRLLTETARSELVALPRDPRAPLGGRRSPVRRRGRRQHAPVPRPRGRLGSAGARRGRRAVGHRVRRRGRHARAPFSHSDRARRAVRG